MEGTVIIQFITEETVVQGDVKEFSQGRRESLGARIPVETCLPTEIMDFFFYVALLTKETVPLKSTSGLHGQGETMVECLHHLGRVP